MYCFYNDLSFGSDCIDDVADAVDLNGHVGTHVFELERVKNVLLQTAEWQQDEESASYVRKMTDEVAAFVGDAPQADDLTMLVIRWKG